MNLYEIDKGGYERYFVVAESYSKAEEMWKERYKSSPKEITMVSPYVLVQK